MIDYVVYKHVNKINNKVYIGITNNINVRWRNGGIEYRPHKNRNQNVKFWNAIKKYGFGNFEHKIICSGLSYKQACDIEKRMIVLYKAREREQGYNTAIGGNGGHIYLNHPKGMKGKRQTTLQIKKLKNIMSNPSNNPMKNGTVVWGVTNSHPKGMSGKKQSLQHAQAMKEKNSGANNKNSLLLRVSINGEESFYYGYRELEDITGIKYAFARKVIESGKPYQFTSHSRIFYKQYDGIIIEKIPC